MLWKQVSRNIRDIEGLKDDRLPLAKEAPSFEERPILRGLP
jgi:hypothetical protein